MVMAGLKRSFCCIKVESIGGSGSRADARMALNRVGSGSACGVGGMPPTPQGRIKGLRLISFRARTGAVAVATTLQLQPVFEFQDGELFDRKVLARDEIPIHLGEVFALRETLFLSVHTVTSRSKFG